MGKLDSLLSRSSKVGLDTSILISHFHGDPVFGPVATRIISRLSQDLEAVVSTLAVTELLVRPFRNEERSAVDKIVDLLGRIPGCRFLPPDFGIAVEAARLRARYSLAAVDSLHLATSLVAGVDLFITHDSDFKKAAGKEKVKVVMLEEGLA